jgi:hypothetical protein
MGFEGGMEKFDGEDICARSERVGGNSFVSTNKAGWHVIAWWHVAVKKGGVDNDGGAKDLMGLLPKAAVIASHRPLCRSDRERSSCRALFCRFCWGHGIDGSYMPCGRCWCIVHTWGSGGWGYPR